jgi:hypothetical protein
MDSKVHILFACSSLPALNIFRSPIVLYVPLEVCAPEVAENRVGEYLLRIVTVCVDETDMDA